MLKKLMLMRKLKMLTEELEEHRSKEDEFAKREQDLEEAIDEVETDEEVEAVNEEISDFEEERTTYEEKKKELEEQIKELEDEIDDIEKKEAEAVEQEEEEKVTEEREEKRYMGKEMEVRDITAREVVKRDDVKDFLTRTREFVSQNRAVTGADLLIPEVLVGILRDNLHKYSKLISKVWLRPVKGTGRMILPGEIPEAIWTEACGTLNELDINFNEAEIDGYKVGGYIPVCNATLKDASDISLYNEIMTMLSQAIGLAIDKAILYGTGNKMPLGIVTRLAQTQEPENRPNGARKWENLSSTNVLKVAGDTGKELFADLILKTGAMKNNYGSGKKFWVMNEATYNTILSRLVEFDSSGVIVASMNNTMPILNGDIVLLPFIPGGDIIGGYGENYLLAEREGIVLENSTHVQFIEDNTVFKAIARYDGQPAIAEAFIALNISGGEVTKEMTFAPDKANEQAEAEVPEA